MEDLPREINMQGGEGGYSGFDFVADCVPDFFSPLFFDLNLDRFSRITYTGPSRLCRLFDVWSQKLDRPVSYFHTEPDSDQSVFWKIPQSDLVLVFDSFLHITNKYASIRKLVTKLDPGGCVVVATTHSPQADDIRRDAAAIGFEYDPETELFKSKARELSVLDMFVFLTIQDFEKVGFKWIKRSMYKNRALCARSEVHDSITDDAGSYFNSFEYSAKEGLHAQKSPFIPSDKVLEKAALHVMMFRKPAISSPALLKEPIESVFGPSGKLTVGDRRVDYFIDEQVCSKLSSVVLEKMQRILGWSFSRLKMGLDYDCFSGRSAYITLVDEQGLPCPVTIGDYTIKSLKLKGATFDSDKEFDTFDAVPESMLGFDPQGVFFHTNFDDKPMGSMTFGQAANEFKVMKRAVQNGVLTDFPVGMCCFPDILFQNKKTGAAIIGVNETEPSDKYRFFAQFNELLGHTDIDENKHLIKLDSKHLPKALKVLVSYGKQLRHFHDAGLLHVLGHNNQISVRGELISFHDFEYSLLQDGMTIEQRTAYRIQDLRRALCGIKIYKSGTAIGVDFAQALLSGYFFDQKDHKLFIDLNEEKLNDKLMLFFQPELALKDPVIDWMLQKAQLTMENE